MQNKATAATSTSPSHTKIKQVKKQTTQEKLNYFKYVAIFSLFIVIYGITIVIAAMVVLKMISGEIPITYLALLLLLVPTAYKLTKIVTSW